MVCWCWCSAYVTLVVLQIYSFSYVMAYKGIHSMYKARRDDDDDEDANIEQLAALQCNED